MARTGGIDWHHWTTGAWLACIALMLAALAEWGLGILCDEPGMACTRMAPLLLWSEVVLLCVAVSGILYACWRGWQRAQAPRA